MRPARFLLLFLFSILLCISVAAQQTSSPSARDPQAMLILHQAISSVGGTTWQGITDATLFGQVAEQRAIDQVQGTITFQVTSAGKCRVDMSIEGESISYIVNGNRGFEVFGGKTRRLPYHSVLNHHLKYLPVFSELTQVGDPAYQVSYLGTQTLNGHAVHHIHTERMYRGQTREQAKVLSRLSATELYIDAQSFLLLKRAQVVPSAINIENSILMEQYFSDYRAIGGVLVPHTVSIYVGNQKVREITFTSVTFNTGVSPAIFEVPR
jgi:outer membrane lipoprotein-sorting protein